ncbi:MAG: spore germination protein [Clostridiaceae bacterium]
MFDFIKNILSLSENNNNNNNNNNQSDNNSSQTPKKQKIKVSPILEKNKESIKTIFSNCSDIIIRDLKITNNPAYSAMIVYVNNMIESSVVEETILKKLSNTYQEPSFKPNSKEYSKYLLGIRDEDIFHDIENIMNAILSGKLALFIDGVNEAMTLSVTKPPGRGIEEPQVESVIRGPREGFTESISTNMVLLRKRLKSQNLKMETIIIGRETRTDVGIVYMSNIANKKIVDEVKERLKKVDIDAVLAANYLKEYIEDSPLLGFPTTFSTERPDVVTAHILEGRVAVFVDGTPLVFCVPAIFFEFFETSEDFYLAFVPATINHLLRYICFFLTLTLPSMYIAIIAFHQELIPTSLLVTIVKSRSGVPYSSLLECTLMLLAFEMLREAGTRMPKAVGQAISVVGALVLGQAAVEAGLVSTPMVIVVSITAVSSYAIPHTDMVYALTFPRFILLLIAGFLGLFGVTCGLIILFLMLISIRSYGVPYMAPLAPFIKASFPNILARLPIWATPKRPWLFTWKETTRRKPESHFKSMNMGKKRK